MIQIIENVSIKRVQNESSYLFNYNTQLKTVIIYFHVLKENIKLGT